MEMSKDITSIEANNTWIVQSLPPVMKNISPRRIYKSKFNVDGSLDRHETQLVAKIYTK